MSLFGKIPAADETVDRSRPLADRMRPRTLEEYVGQQHLLAPVRIAQRQAGGAAAVVGVGRDAGEDRVLREGHGRQVVAHRQHMAERHRQPAGR